MDRSSTLFWGAIALLFSCSAFYSFSVGQEMKKLHTKEAKIENGSIVALVKVVDGDAVVVTLEGQGSVIVRLLGIKSFDAKIEKDVTTPYAQAAMDALNRLLADKPVRVMLNAPPKDRSGRFIATLFVDDQDIALRLVKEGLVLVYPVYPFPAMSLYLEQQELAKAARRGLWSNSDVSGRAFALMDEWRRQRE
jgi:micrococcal nuclease